MNNQKFQDEGYVILRTDELTEQLKELRVLYNKEFAPLIDDNKPESSRRVISLFAKHPLVMNYIMSVGIYLPKLHVKTPLLSGPAVTHYTSFNAVGNGFGLSYHQDWPSMASSLNSVVVWTSLTPTGIDTHGLELLPKSHNRGLLEGEVTEAGYIINPEILNSYKSIIPNMKNGGTIIFSSWLIHRTYLNVNYRGYKLAFSQRFDDFTNTHWKKNGFATAYKNEVDRDLFRKYLPQ